MRAEVEIEGLRELRRALRRIDPQLTDGLKDVHRDVAEMVVPAARARAPRSSRPRGAHMADTIKARASASAARVVVTAKRRSPAYPTGYAYPKRIHFTGTPFITDAIDSMRERIVDRYERLTDDIADSFDQGGI